MRITNVAIARNYTSNLNKNLGALNNSNVKMAAGGRKFLNMAENPSSGIRAMGIRRSIANLNGYKDNAQHALNVFNGAENTLMQLSDLTKDISTKLTSALNGTNSEDERKIIAGELEKLRDEILLSANGQYAGRYFFGGTNTKSQPFVYDKDTGKLLYNGVDVSTIDKSTHAYLFNDAAYVDIGLGMAMSQGADSQNVITNTAFKNTMVGLDVFGYGNDNIILVIDEIINLLTDPSFDAEEGGKLLNKFLASADSINLQITKIGSDTQYLDFTISRLESENDNLIERQDALEFMDPTELIMELKMQEYVYNAALQMGSRLLQPTIFDFIR